MDTVTPNEVIAFNLRKARELRGWTHKEAAARLKALGLKWERSTYSLAEGTYLGKDRKRQFTLDDISIFAICFGVPVVYFFVPPHLGSGETLPITPDPSHIEGMTPSEFVQLVLFNGWTGMELLNRRLKELTSHLDPDQRNAIENAFFMGHGLLINAMVSGQGRKVDDLVNGLTWLAELLQTARKHSNDKIRTAFQQVAYDYMEDEEESGAYEVPKEKEGTE